MEESKNLLSLEEDTIQTVELQFLDDDKNLIHSDRVTVKNASVSKLIKTTCESTEEGKPKNEGFKLPLKSCGASKDTLKCLISYMNLYKGFDEKSAVNFVLEENTKMDCIVKNSNFPLEEYNLFFNFMDDIKENIDQKKHAKNYDLSKVTTKFFYRFKALYDLSLYLDIVGLQTKAAKILSILMHYNNIISKEEEKKEELNPRFDSEDVQWEFDQFNIRCLELDTARGKRGKKLLKIVMAESKIKKDEEQEDEEREHVMSEDEEKSRVMTEDEEKSRVMSEDEEKTEPKTSKPNHYVITKKC